MIVECGSWGGGTSPRVVTRRHEEIYLGTDREKRLMRGIWTSFLGRNPLVVSNLLLYAARITEIWLARSSGRYDTIEGTTGTHRYPVFINGNTFLFWAAGTTIPRRTTRHAFRYVGECLTPPMRSECQWHVGRNAIGTTGLVQTTRRTPVMFFKAQSDLAKRKSSSPPPRLQSDKEPFHTFIKIFSPTSRPSIQC